MIILDKKKPISALKLIHTLNHTKVNRLCDIHTRHYMVYAKYLEYTINERIYNLKAGLYKIKFNDIEYIINILFNLSNGDFLVIKDEYNIILYMAGSIAYNIIPYRINKEKLMTSTTIKTINDNIDMVAFSYSTHVDGSPSLDNPMKINRLPFLNITSESDMKFSIPTIPLHYTIGGSLNAVNDFVIINLNQSIVQYIINTTKEVLSGGLDWEYKPEYSDSDYYVFFAEYPNVKLSSSNKSIRCSHFESESCTNLLDKSTKKNCIAVSDASYKNGIWIKIDASVLDIHGNKNFSTEMKKWIISQAVTKDGQKAEDIKPIYIEYEITNTIYKTFSIDKYDIKTWYGNTEITTNPNVGLSVFYKSL